MKKLFLTAVVSFINSKLSARQFMVVTTYDGDQEEQVDKITTFNLGVGFEVMDGLQ